MSSGMSRTSWRSRVDSAALTPRTSRGKNGSLNSSVVGSVMTRAIESLRRVTRLRAARLGTYPRRSMAFSTERRTSGLTCGDPLTTRETVALETPATRATSSRVATGLAETGSSWGIVEMGLAGTVVALPVRALSRSGWHHITRCQESVSNSVRWPMHIAGAYISRPVGRFPVDAARLHIEAIEGPVPSPTRPPPGPFDAAEAHHQATPRLSRPRMHHPAVGPAAP